MRTCSLQSGSNGNCIYVETAGVRLLFDAGISGKQARLRLESHHINIRDIDALILSHGHADHTRCAGVFQRLFHFPIYATRATYRAIAPHIGRVKNVQTFIPGRTLEFGPVRVHTIPTPHDADGSVAFVVEADDCRLGILTDLGHPFDDLGPLLGTLDAVYLESNYDPEMLATGPYPPELQARISGPAGHIANHEAADLLARHANGRLRWVALAHLSAENNTPELALDTHRQRVAHTLPLHVASRYHVSDLLEV